MNGEHEKTVDAPTEDQNRTVCTWSHDTDDDMWETTCGHAFVFSDGGPKESEMKFCCYCGGALKEAT